MATRHSTSTTPTVKPSTAQNAPLLAYDLHHPDILVGEIPALWLEVRRNLRRLLETLPIDSSQYQFAVSAIGAQDRLWFKLMDLGKESHTVPHDPVTL